MNAHTEAAVVAGPAGAIECAIDHPAGTPRGVAVVCHPHPLHGGTMTNKVAQTLARALVQLGYRTVRFNFRGVGASAGSWDEGRGEVDDARAVITAHRAAGEPLVLAGFSFGGSVASRAAAAVAEAGAPVQRLVLVAPAVINFPMAAVPDDTLLLHGETDDVVPLSAVMDWARPTALPITVVPGVGHFFHGQLPRLKSLVLQGLAG
ncbi:MAG: hypothetical protein RJA98_1547 [Pseudomonadota bacterium]|jgi:alpha/beta superfamily hydrolase